MSTTIFATSSSGSSGVVPGPAFVPPRRVEKLLRVAPGCKIEATTPYLRPSKPLQLGRKHFLRGHTGVMQCHPAMPLSGKASRTRPSQSRASARAHVSDVQEVQILMLEHVERAVQALGFARHCREPRLNIPDGFLNYVVLVG